MAENSRFQFLIRRSSPVTKIVATAAIVLSIMALVALRWAQIDIETQTRQMRAEAAQLEAENEQLQGKIDRLGSVGSVQEIAQEELGMVDPDTVIIETG